MAENAPSTKRFGTFSGVFRPISLTVLGAMLYLREGWLVGNCGLLGAVGVLFAAAAITGLTSLSLASIATNVRVRRGGAFAIVSQALGLEAGGAIGIPLYIAQSLSAAMYIYAFSEAWVYIFPSHPPRLVAGLGFAAVALLAWRSASLALRAQAVLFVVIMIAILSAFGGWGTVDTLHVPQLIGDFREMNLRDSFALFFPAVTGIMVGVGMSGNLAHPRRSIPRGTLLAWGFTAGVYLIGAVWYATVADPAELLNNTTIMLERAALGELVLGGLVCSTLMAALSSLVASPRLLQAMAAHAVVPGSAWLAREHEGEPRNAVVATTILAGLGLLAGSLDAIAPVITSFFIMTYLTINLVVYVEQALGMISWRPTFTVPRATSMFGAGACVVGLALGSPFGGLFELALVFGIYVVLAWRRLETPWETVRSGVSVAMAGWAARQVGPGRGGERAWKPDLLVPVASVTQCEGLMPLVESVAGSNGSVRLVSVGPREDLPDSLPEFAERLQRQGLDARWITLDSPLYMHAILVTIDALEGALFPPNLVVVDAAYVSNHEIAEYLHHCRAKGVGMMLYFHHPDGTLGPRDGVNVWVSDRSPEWELKLHQANLDLPVLVGYLVSQAWDSGLRLVSVVRDGEQVPHADRFLRQLAVQARLPDAQVLVGEGAFMERLARSPKADLHIFGMPPVVDKARLEAIRDTSGGAAIFLLDSGQESALA